ncbi:MATE family efflux transporter [uncultured Muriicola sp.]|uniref:MATE family efflux transporter n=1 Tax=uncultured Muriicola sp. TaxID=1583102 RepID=UPI002620C7C0|nr:MATE family efflux transporter [uncultured Muriicola sp.]
MAIKSGNVLYKIYNSFLDAVKGKQTEFTSGSIRKAIFMLSVPMILEMMMESIFAIVDIAYVSQISVNAVATIGLTESVVTLVYAIAIGLSMAATAVVARRIGEKDEFGASQAAVQAIFLGIVVAVIIGIIGLVYSREILSLMGGSSDLIAEGHGYTKFLIGGNITIVLLFLINAIFRGAGDASIAMWTLILSNGLNIILDPIFIFGLGPVPEFGVMGAAIATNIGRGSAVIFQLYILFRGGSRIRLYTSNLVLKLKIMLNLIRVSMGGIAQFLIGTSSWVFLMRLMAEFGSEALAGYTIAIRVMMFTFMPAWGMSNAAATLVGQNLGAEEPERAEKSVWLTGKYNAIFMFCISLVYLLFAEGIIGLFTKVPSVIENGSLCLQVVAAGYVFYAYGMVVTQAFNGAGDTRTPTKINFIAFWLIQLPFAYLVSLYLDWGVMGVYIAITLAEVLLSVMAVIWFRKGYWKQTVV